MVTRVCGERPGLPGKNPRREKEKPRAGGRLCDQHQEDKTKTGFPFRDGKPVYSFNK